VVLSTRVDGDSTILDADSPVANLHDKVQREDRSSSQQSPKHSRIPSTGKRATVMDVAQALHESSNHATNTVDRFEKISSNPDPSPSAKLNRPQNTLPFAVNAEKRKSSYEKYSAIILPPLKEEATPVPSPAGSLSRMPGDTQRQTFGGPSIQQPEVSSAFDKTRSGLGMWEFF
jgi:hypothetical protein